MSNIPLSPVPPAMNRYGDGDATVDLDGDGWRYLEARGRTPAGTERLYVSFYVICGSSCTSNPVEVCVDDVSLVAE